VPLSNKTQLGQFFSTHAEEMLQDFHPFIENKECLDPFAGKHDLLHWAHSKNARSISGFDIDLSIHPSSSYNDSLISIPYSPFLITNPPYLAKNKMNAVQKNKYMKDCPYDDLYMLALDRIVASKTEEGIVILPINFLSAENAQPIRKLFFSHYSIAKCRYFTEPMFDDTSYNVVAFYFVKQPSKNIVIESYPDSEILSIDLDDHFNLKNETIEKIRATPSSLYRLTEDHIVDNPGSLPISCYFNDRDHVKQYTINESLFSKIQNNIIVMNCIDSTEKKICLEDRRNFNTYPIVGKSTSRNLA